MKQEELVKIERYINGLSDKDEKSFVESLFTEGESNNDLRNLLEKEWTEKLKDSSPSEVNLTHILDHVHHIIRKRETLKKQKPLQKFLRAYKRAAAILLLPIIIAGGFIYNYMNKPDIIIPDQQVSSSIYAPMGSRVSFNLPDGTTGMLNSGSELTYSIPFSNKRQVNLIGEAWFEVFRDEANPFEISTGNSLVKVLGTSFNMSAYPDENYIEIVLKEGKVVFQDSSYTEMINILPSERMISQNGMIKKTLTDPLKYNAWTEGKLVFREDPMAEVARRIERWYNVKVILADKELEKYSFRGTFEDDKLEEVLKYLSMTSPIRYNITSRKLHSDGTVEKEKVTIYLKHDKSNL